MCHKIGVDSQLQVEGNEVSESMDELFNTGSTIPPSHIPPDGDIQEHPSFVKYVVGIIVIMTHWILAILLVYNVLRSTSFIHCLVLEVILYGIIVLNLIFADCPLSLLENEYIQIYYTSHDWLFFWLGKLDHFAIWMIPPDSKYNFWWNNTVNESSPNDCEGYSKIQQKTRQQLRHDIILKGLILLLTIMSIKILTILTFHKLI